MSEFADLSFDTTIGALLIGVLVSGALWGISCLQFYHYLGAYPEDKWPLKALVAGLWVLDTTHQILISHATYTYVITHYADELFILTTPVQTVLVSIPVQAFIAFIVQLFFVNRIWRLSHYSILLSGAVLALALAQLVSLMLTTARIYNAPPNWIAKSYAIRVLEPTGAALSTCTDVLIAGVMLWLLQRSKTGFQRTDGLLSKLMMFSMGTGLMTTLNSLIILITYYAQPNTLVYLGCFFVIGRLYVNSFLASLNLRRVIVRPPAGATSAGADAGAGAPTAAPPDALFSSLGSDLDLDSHTGSNGPYAAGDTRRAAYGPARASRAFPPAAVVPGGGVSAFRRWKGEHAPDEHLGADGREDAESEHTATSFAQTAPVHDLVEDVRSRRTPFPPKDVEDEPIFSDHPYRLARARED